MTQYEQLEAGRGITLLANMTRIANGEQVQCMSTYCIEKFEPWPGLDADEQYCIAHIEDAEDVKRTSESSYYQPF
jgi:hypothetical protein